MQDERKVRYCIALGFGHCEECRKQEVKQVLPQTKIRRTMNHVEQERQKRKMAPREQTPLREARSPQASAAPSCRVPVSESRQVGQSLAEC
jgi:hypothetical protein